MPSTISSLIDLGRSLQELSRKVFDKPVDKKIVGMGADGTVTHEVDRVFDRAVLDYVRENGIPLNVVSEESGFTDLGFKESLIIDPIDGTFNAESGIPFYSFSCAVVKDTVSSASMAVVLDIPRGRMFHAVRNSGAFLDGHRISVSRRMVGCAIGGLGRSGHDHASPILNGGWRIRSLGCASLELCLVAQGAADVMCYTGTGNYLRNVDVAGGVLILREAGGVALGDDFGEFDMGLDVRERKSIIGASSKEIAEVLR